LNLDRFLNLSHFAAGDAAGAVDQPQFADGCQLVCHGFGFHAIYLDHRFAWIKSLRLACQEDNLNPVKKSIGTIITDNHRRAIFLISPPADGSTLIHQPAPRFMICIRHKQGIFRPV
jgi:hypothetical protein